MHLKRLARMGLQTVPKLKYALLQHYISSWKGKLADSVTNSLRYHPIMACLKASRSFGPSEVERFLSAKQVSLLFREEWFETCGLGRLVFCNIEEGERQRAFANSLMEAKKLLAAAGETYLDEFMQNCDRLCFFAESVDQWKAFCDLQLITDQSSGFAGENLPSKTQSAASFSNALGLSIASLELCGDPLRLALQLSHEMTHQLVFALESQPGFLKPTAITELYSPARNAMRPVAAVLHGAFTVLKECEFLSDLSNANSKNSGIAIEEITSRALKLRDQKWERLDRSVADIGRLEGIGPSLLFDAFDAFRKELYQ
jgi:hypothetical protein